MSALRKELRRKFKTPEECADALGLDRKLLSKENIMSKPTLFAARALQVTAAAIAPFLAQDAKLDLFPVFKGLTAKDPFDKAKFSGALDAALKGKLAADMKAQDIAEMVHHLHGMSQSGKDEAVSEEQEAAMKAAAKGEDKAKDKAKDSVPEGKEFPRNALDWLKANDRKAYDAMTKACDWEDPDEAEDEEEESEKDNEEQKKAKAAEDKAKDNKEHAMDGAVTQQAFDKAMKAQEKAIRESVRTEFAANQRDMREAEALCRTKVGDLSAMTFDSAENMLRHTAKLLGVDDHETLPVAALRPIIKCYPDAGAKRTEHRPVEQMGMDAAARTSVHDEFKDTALGRIKVGV